MISNEQWAELEAEWSTIGPVYQIPRRSKDRLKHFCEVALPYLEGKRVLEIGANAGLFGYEISKVAECYVGVEPGNKIIKKGKKPKTNYFKQLELTHKYMKDSKVFNETIKEYCKHPEDCNAFVATFALYHFTDKELKLLKEMVWPVCDTIVIQNRNQDRPTKHNSHKFWKDKNVIEFFFNQGFAKIKHVPFSSKDGKQQLSEIICLR